MLDAKTLQSLKDFSDWFSSYNSTKKNQQDFGIQNFPARVFRKTIDLTTAGVFQTTGVPFNGFHVEKIYTTATGLSVDGNIKINFDRAMVDSNYSYKKLVENDCALLGFSAANAFLSWDAQSGVSVDLVFFNDIDYKAGSTKTSVTGTVTVQEATPVAIKTVPNLVTRLVGNNATASYTVRAGYYARVYWSITGSTSNTSSVSVGGTKVIDINGASALNFALSGQTWAKAGDVVSCVTNAAGNTAYVQVVEFPV